MFGPKIISILPVGNLWKIRCDHCDEATRANKAEAIAAAKKHVAEFPPGAISQIKVQQDSGEYFTEWTYGTDPFPEA